MKTKTVVKTKSATKAEYRIYVSYEGYDWDYDRGSSFSA